MKSIYNQDDLRCNTVGLDIKFLAETFFYEILKKYPDYDPREMVGLCLSEFDMIAARKILDMRRSEILEKDIEIKKDPDDGRDRGFLRRAGWVRYPPGDKWAGECWTPPEDPMNEWDIDSAIARQRKLNNG